MRRAFTSKMWIPPLSPSIVSPGGLAADLHILRLSSERNYDLQKTSYQKKQNETPNAEYNLNHLILSTVKGKLTNSTPKQSTPRQPGRVGTASPADIPGKVSRIEYLASVMLQ